MSYIEHEIKIIYREQANIGRKIYLPYEVSCEGRYCGFGSTLEEAIKDFDKNNIEQKDNFIGGNLYEEV